MKKIEKISDSINKYNIYSTEGVIDFFKEIGIKIINFIKKMILALETFVKMIIAKIYEWRLKSKHDIYQNFKNQVFNSLDLYITDRRLQPKLIARCTDFIESMKLGFQSIEKFSIDDDKQLSWDLLSFFNSNQSKLLENLVEKANYYRYEKDEKFLDSLFYRDKEKQKMTLRNYFGSCTYFTPGDQCEDWVSDFDSFYENIFII